MFPSITDGRNLLYSIIGKEEWSPIFTVAKIITMIPEFISISINNPICGHFNLDETYTISFWSKCKEYIVMKCKEKQEMEDSLSPTRIMVLTDNVFLLLEPGKNNSDQGILISWGFLYSLLKIKIISKNVMQFYWLSKFDKVNVWIQRFVIEDDTETFVKMINEKMIKLGEIQVKIVNIKMINEDEVQPKSVMQIDINQVNENIAIYESKLEADPSINKFQTLMVLYQKAIEYYSALENPIHKEYIKKLHDLLQTREAQFLLPEETKAPKPIFQEDEKNVKIEEDKKDNKTEEIKKDDEEEDIMVSISSEDKPIEAKTEDSEKKIINEESAEKPVEAKVESKQEAEIEKFFKISDD